jgi:hypothetical protein
VKRERAIFVGIPAAAALLCIWRYEDFGITWDENVQRQYGDMVLNYFSSGFQDTRCNEFLNLYFYGGIVELLSACCYETFGTAVYPTRHLVTGIIAAVTVPAVMLYGRRMGRSLWLPVFCGLALLGLPRFLGHACNNSKDIPLAAMFAVAMFAIAWLLSQDRMSWKAVALAAIPVGLTLAVRVGGVLVLAYACAGVVLRIAQRWPARPDLKGALGRMALFIGMAWLLMLAFWPWAQQNPILHPVKAFQEATAFSHAKQVLFAGEILSSKALPRSYLAHYLAITIPVPLLVLGIVGVLIMVRRQLRTPRSPAALHMALAQLWFFFPIAYFAVTRPNVYDGMRHFLFILPAFAICAGYGAEAVRRGLWRIFANSATARHCAAMGLLLMLLWPWGQIIALHPYQSSYFNGAVGGTAGAMGRYDVDYWASSYKEAAEWLNARQQKQSWPLEVLVGGNRNALVCCAEYLDPGIIVTPLNQTGAPGEINALYQVYVGMARFGMLGNYPQSPIVHTIGREGAIFAVIRERE